MNIFNIISFYEEVVYNFKKQMDNQKDLDLLIEQINYSYSLANIVKEKASKIRLSDSVKNMEKYLVYDNGCYRLNNYGVTLAIASALFHNIGSYNQILIYQELNDDIKDNQEVGLNYLLETKILKFLTVQDQLVIYEVVHNHNRDTLDYLDNCCGFYVNLIKSSKRELEQNVKKLEK